MVNSRIKQINPVISVVMSVYNKGELLRNSLISALKQKFNGYEIVIVDDGSTDNSKDIISEFKDSKIRYYYQFSSGLPAVARNNGIRYSNGKYIAFLDADDIWYPDKLNKCYEVLNINPDIDLVCHNEIIKDVSGRVIQRASYGPYVADMFRKLLFQGNCLSPSATVVKKEVLMKVGLFREYLEFFSVEDYDLWLTLARKYKFYFIPEVLGEYILHDRNISSDIEKHYNNQIEVIKRNFKEYNEKKKLDFYLINYRLSRIYFIIARYFLSKKMIGRASNYVLKTFLQFFSLQFFSREKRTKKNR